jgi:GAF domain-containing protein
MGVLLETGQQIAATLELETMLGTLVTQATRLAGASYGWIFLVSVEDEQVTRRAAHGLDENMLENLDYCFLRDGLAGWVIRERIPAISRDLLDDERVTGRARRWIAEQGLRSAAVIPLQTKEQVVGILAVMNRRDDPPLTRQDIDLLAVMASQAAVALENAELFAERERNITELSILYQTGQAISASLNLEAILNTIYTQVSQMMDTTNFYIAFYDEETGQVSFPFVIEHGERKDWSPTFAAGSGVGAHGRTGRRRQRYGGPLLARRADAGRRPGTGCHLCTTLRKRVCLRSRSPERALYHCCAVYRRGTQCTTFPTGARPG